MTRFRYRVRSTHLGLTLRPHTTSPTGNKCQRGPLPYSILSTTGGHPCRPVAVIFTCLEYFLRPHLGSRRFTSPVTCRTLAHMLLDISRGPVPVPLPGTGSELVQIILSRPDRLHQYTSLVQALHLNRTFAHSYSRIPPRHDAVPVAVLCRSSRNSCPEDVSARMTSSFFGMVAITPRIFPAPSRGSATPVAAWNGTNRRLMPPRSCGKQSV